MAANDDFPHKFYLSTVASATQTPTITVLGNPQCQTVLTLIKAQLYNGASATAFAPEIETGTGYVFGFITCETSLVNLSEFELSDDNGVYVTTPGAPVIVTFSGPLPASYSATLRVMGYVI